MESLLDAPRTAVSRVATGTVLVGVAAFVLIAVTQVPWARTPDPVAPSSVFTTDQIERAEHFARWARTWSWSSLAVSLATACWLGFGRSGRDLAGKVRGWWWVRIVVVVAVLVLIGRIVTLPFAVASRQLRLDEGLAAGTWNAWTVDLIKGEAINIVLTSLAVTALVACARQGPRMWPAVAGAGAAALVMVGSFVYPVLIEPVFNDFTSLPEGDLRTEVLALAAEEGVEVDDVLVADASRRTTTLNAYVSGIGQTRRVVLYDNLVDDAPQAETLSVVAHELAHAKHDDVILGTSLGAAGALAAVGMLGLLIPVGGSRGVTEAGTVPRLLALAAVGALLAGPLQNGVSRQIELRADRTALEATSDPESFAALQRRLALRSHADPTPPAWSQWWFGSHPTVLQRLGLVAAWRDGAVTSGPSGE